MTRPTAMLSIALVLFITTSINAQVSRQLIPQSLFVQVAANQEDNDETEDVATATDAPIVINGKTMAIDEYELFRKYDIESGDAKAGPNDDSVPCDRRKLRRNSRVLQLGWGREKKRGMSNYNDNDDDVDTECKGKRGKTDNDSGRPKVKKHKKSNEGKGRKKSKGYYAPQDDDDATTRHPTAGPTTNLATLSPTVLPVTDTVMPTMAFTGTDAPSLSTTKYRPRRSHHRGCSSGGAFTCRISCSRISCHRQSCDGNSNSRNSRKRLSNGKSSCTFYVSTGAKSSTFNTGASNSTGDASIDTKHNSKFASGNTPITKCPTSDDSSNSEYTTNTRSSTSNNSTNSKYTTSSRYSAGNSPANPQFASGNSSNTRCSTNNDPANSKYTTGPRYSASNSPPYP
jgi:hypothetical protein